MTKIFYAFLLSIVLLFLTGITISSKKEENACVSSVSSNEIIDNDIALDTIDMNREEYNDMFYYNIEEFVINAPYYQCEVERIKEAMLSIGVSGGAVLDAASGAGRWSRISADLGAKRVLGLDLSPGMDEIAQNMTRHPRYNGVIRYGVHDMNDELDDEYKHQFNAAMSVHLLCHASSVEMVRRFYAVLRSSLILSEHSKILTVMENYDMNPFMYPLHLKYGWIETISPQDLFVFEQSGRLLNGTELLMTGFIPVPYSMTMWVYSKALHEEILREVGFQNIQWIEFTCNVYDFYADDKSQREFAQDYYRHRTNVAFTAEVAL